MASAGNLPRSFDSVLSRIANGKPEGGSKMRPTNKYSCLLSLFPDYVATPDDEEYECDICGFEPMFELFEWRCSVANGHEGLDERWDDQHLVCLDCDRAGADSFPERLRKHAETLEKRARELRKLAADAKWTPGWK